MLLPQGGIARRAQHLVGRRPGVRQVVPRWLGGGAAGSGGIVTLIKFPEDSREGGPGTSLRYDNIQLEYITELFLVFSLTFSVFLSYGRITPGGHLTREIWRPIHRETRQRNDIGLSGVIALQGHARRDSKRAASGSLRGRIRVLRGLLL